jgi:hypothetical protein
MASSYQVQAGSLLYTVTDDCTTTYWAILTGAVTDEILGGFYCPQFIVEITRNDLNTKTIATGLYALSGYPSQSFPQLNSTSYTISLLLSAPGFRSYPLSVTIPQNSTFPVIVQTVAMRRLPIRLQGRVVSDATGAPLVGALVLSIDNPTSPPAAHTTALRSPLYFDHAKGVVVQQVTMSPSGTASLVQDAAAGQQILNLTTRTGLAANSVIQLANAGQVLVEYGVVDHLGPGAASQPGQVFLRNNLNRTYTAGASTIVQFVNSTATGTSAVLTSDANAGDGVLLATQLLNGTTVQLEPATVSVEYHEVGAISDSQGYYGFDGIGRVPEVFLQATQGGSKKTQNWFVEYDQPINLVDFRL